MKAKKFFLALGVIAPLASLPVIAASCGDNKPNTPADKPGGKTGGETGGETGGSKPGGSFTDPDEFNQYDLEGFGKYVQTHLKIVDEFKEDLKNLANPGWSIWYDYASDWIVLLDEKGTGRTSPDWLSRPPAAIEIVGYMSDLQMTSATQKIYGTKHRPNGKLTHKVKDGKLLISFYTCRYNGDGGDGSQHDFSKEPFVAEIDLGII
ncbi:hypothetical protein JN00_0335 [Metamycoplasma subdolum]|uniref:Lipoprotein n=1 Tax=Metamycoplasma subdolum TaxID=92407 RepID=A0A3M0A7Q9_9BACT|nr:variable surface lipoprotein [Metamycoplasma subdolum]RMA78505.1 hypothetical protein JN00_0335 [Metamycoplasma subdolum]WPB50437.1 variable surface lipoprotein [Metamycoplasma subdolum]